MKVLVVDDSATIRDRLVEILSTLQGIEHVDTASRASEARHAIQTAPPDVVVLDIHMPGGSGIEVLDALRAHEQRIMTIVLTNDSAPQWRDACLRGGADFFFDKSADFQQAIDVIARLALDRAAPHDRLPHGWTYFERLPIPAWIVDVDTLEFKAVNDAAVERYGYSRAEFLAMTLADIRPPDAMPAPIEHITERRSGAAIRQPGPQQYRAKDGAAIHVEIAVMPLDHAGRRLDLVLAHDVSERILAEAALRTGESRYRELFENATDAIFTTDLELNLTSFNSVAEALTGFRRDETRGLRVADLVTPDSLELIQHTLADQLAGKPAPMFEAAMLTRSGRQVLIEVGVRLVYRDGQPFGTQAIARDMTGRKQLEEQVRQSQKMASVGHLAGGIAHDFNNLLTAIAGYGELLHDRLAADPAALDDLGEIRRAVASAVDLTRQLLAFSRKQLLAPRTISLNDVVTDLQKMLRRLIEENVQIDFALSPDLDRVYVDPGQMEQVLVNLAVNARDAMPEGGVLTIETANVWLDDAHARAHVGMGPGPHVALSVSDTGLGMTADVQARVFEPFFTTKPMGQGAGLGLATVHGIVHQSGGYIWVDSEPGVGTTFKLYFPVASGEPLPEPARSRPVSGDLTGTETVLIVEDDARLRALDRRILQRYGYTALVAESAADARRICTEHSGPIDVVLTDVIMPGGSGRTIGDWIREHRPETKVVYMSGYTDYAIARHGVLEPGIHFLQKPFTPETLARKIREALS